MTEDFEKYRTIKVVIGLDEIADMVAWFQCHDLDYLADRMVNHPIDTLDPTAKLIVTFDCRNVPVLTEFILRWV